MKVVWTDEALRDLDAIADWLIVHYPAVAPAIERRIRSVIAHIARWPESSRRSAKRPGVHAVPLGRYPYKSSIVSPAIGWKYSTSITPHGSLGTNRHRLRQAR
jgi:plasmid stabilization system protein ParE